MLVAEPTLVELIEVWEAALEAWKNTGTPQADMERAIADTRLRERLKRTSGGAYHKGFLYEPAGLRFIRSQVRFRPASEIDREQAEGREPSR